LKFNGSTDEIDALFASGKWKTHFSSWDGFDKTNNGIQGCHTLSEIKRLENVTQISDKERLIKIIKDDKIADGVYKIEYVIANKKPTGGYETQIINGKEEYVWRSKTYRKTVIDTSIISVDVAEEWAKEAFENSEIIIHTSMRNGKKVLRYNWLVCQIMD